MRKFLALTRKEASSILLNPPILFATAFFVLLDSFAFYLTMARGGIPMAVFDEIALFMLFTSIVVYPLVSMHAFSEDNASGTLETLLTAPISNLTAVLAKYAGCMIFVAIYLVHGVVYALLLSYGGNQDWNVTLSAFLALVAFGSLAMALGVFVSALTLSPAAAAAGTGGALLFMALAADLDPYSAVWADVFHSISFLPHAKRWIGGQLDTRGLVYFVSGTVLFLFYAWLAVNSRQPDKLSPNATVRRRLTITYFLVATGFVLLLAEAAILHINGFWETGTPLGSHLARVPGRWLVPLALAAVAFFWAALTFRAAKRAERGAQRLVSSPTPRYVTITDTQVMKAPRYFYEENLRARRRIVFTALAALAIVLNANWIAHYPFRTFTDSGRLGFLAHLQGKSRDVSQDRRNSLSPTTLRTLDALQGRVQIYSFLTENLQVHEVPVTEEMRRILSRYADNNSIVSVNYADPIREPELAGRLAAELDINPDSLENTVVIDYQGRRRTLPAALLAIAPDWQQKAAGDSRWVFNGESRLTQSLLDLMDPRVPSVFFTYGHLEHSLSRDIYPERSLARFVRALTGANMRVRQFSLSQGPVPAECDVLVVAGQRVPFRKQEVDAIRNYMDRGGRLLVFAPSAGPDFSVAEDPLNEFLFELGGNFRDDILEDTVNNDHGQALAVLGRRRSGGDSGVRLVFTLSRSVQDNPRSTGNGWVAERMVESFPEARATDMGVGTARPGPFTLAYRAARDTEAGESRAGVFASARLVTDSDIGRGMNEALAVAMTQWLSGREESGNIEPKGWVDRRIRLTGAQLRAVLWIALVALPLVWLLTGISAWWMRRE